MKGRRQDIEEIINLLDTSGSDVALTGGYGAGKSALAVSVAHCVCTGPSPVTDPTQPFRTSLVAIYIDLLGCQTTEGVWLRTVQAFGVHFHYNERRFLYNWINARDQRFLFVYDNIDDLVSLGGSRSDVDRMSELLEEIATRVRNAQMLCVGGNEQFFRRIRARGGQIYRVDDIGCVTANEVLGKLLPDLHANGVTQLAESCGHVALAVRISAAALTPTGSIIIDTGSLFQLLTSPKSELNIPDVVVKCIERLTGGDEFQFQRLQLVSGCLLKVISSLGDNTVSLLRCVACFASGFDRRSANAVFSDHTISDNIEALLDRIITIGLALPINTAERCKRYRLPALVRLLVMATATPMESSQASALYRKEVLHRVATAANRYHAGSDGFLKARAIVETDYDNIVDVLWKTIDRQDACVELSYLTTVEGSAFAAAFLPDDLYIAVYESIECEVEQSGINDCRSVKSRALACLSHRHTMSGRTIDAVRCAERAVELARSPVMPQTSKETNNLGLFSPSVTLAMALYYLSCAQWTAGDRKKAVATGKLAFEAWKCDWSMTTDPHRSGLPVTSSSTEMLLLTPSVGAVYAGEWYAWMLMQCDNVQMARHWLAIFTQNCSCHFVLLLFDIHINTVSLIEHPSYHEVSLIQD